MIKKSVPPLTALLALMAVTAWGVEPNPKVVCDPKTDKLSVEATHVSLTALLNDIAAKCSVEVKVDPDAERLVSARFNDQTIEDGLRSISEDSTQNYVFFYASSKGEGPGNRRVSTLRLYANGKVGGASSSQPVAVSAPAAHQPAASVLPQAASQPVAAKVITGRVSEPDTQGSPPDNEDQNVKARLAAREKLEMRLATLPAEQRQRVLKLEEERQRRRDQRDMAKKKMLEERQRQQQNPDQNQPPTNLPE